jgi:hypothetical protein
MTRPDKAPGQASGQAADPEYVWIEDGRPDQAPPLEDPEGGPPSGDPGPPHEAEEVPEWR